MSGDYDDEELAFRDALHRAAEAEQFESLEPSAVTPVTARRFGWSAAGGVAAVAAVVALVFVLAPRIGPVAAGSAASPSSTQAVPEAAPVPMSSGEITVTSADDGGGATAQASGEAQPPREASSEDPAPGFRWVEGPGVAVQVPEGWGEGMAPGTDWCATDTGAPAGPFVDAGRRSTMAIACTGPVPASRLAMNVQFWKAGTTGPDLQAPWGYQTVTVGDTTVAVTTDGTQPELVSQILASAVPL